MTDEVLNEGAQEAPATDDLRSALRAAVDAQLGTDEGTSDASRSNETDEAGADTRQALKAPQTEKAAGQQ